MSNETASRYIRENFEPNDRLAIVLLNKRINSVVQRLASAQQIAAPDFQSWLQEHNSRLYDVYISMNALAPNAKGRTKKEVTAIRHVYLDFDTDGSEAVRALLERQDVPRPNFLLTTSQDKWQVVWKVDGFGKNQSETLQRKLARATGADIAATDCARVLRLPGFQNHKYAPPYFVRADFLAKDTWRPEHFPIFETPEPIGKWDTLSANKGEMKSSRNITQSERDWAYAKRALGRGDSQESVIAAIASYRRYDKPNPRYYAELTVCKAAEALRADSRLPDRR